MRRCFVAAVLAVIMLLPVCVSAMSITLPMKKGDDGPGVHMVQQRLLELGYLNFSPTGTYGDLTVNGVWQFQTRSGLPADGMLGESTYSDLFAINARRAELNASIPRVSGAGLMQLPPEYGVKSTWLEIDNIFTVGMVATVTDFNTLRTFDVQRTGGTHHADVKPVAESDDAERKASFGGGQSWEKRPVLVEISGVKYAGSMFGMPNANGEYCIYFTGSGSDIGGLKDAEHEAVILSCAKSE